MKTITTIGVIGAGQMGAGIAQVSAFAGYQTKLFDANEASSSKALTSIHGHLARMLEKEKITSAELDNTKSNLKVAPAISDLSSCDLVIEAIVEKAEIKVKVFEELDCLLAEDAIIASNTSSISITRLAASTKRSDRFIGMHFMNPVPLMKLVEVIRGLQTSDQTYQAALDVCAKMQKTTVLGIDGPGFIVNRILCPMINEAIFLLQEGVAPLDIDNAMKLGTNQPMGPLELADFVGLDTLLYILQLLHRELGEDKYRPCPLLAKYVEAGWHGRKNGRGFYQY